MKKIFKIVETGYTYHYRYRVLQRHTILFFIHFWTSPEYAPPHLFHTAEDAAMQGMIANTQTFEQLDHDKGYKEVCGGDKSQIIAIAAVMYADALVEKLKKGGGQDD